MRVVIFALLCVLCTAMAVLGQGTQPIVAIHDSELTRALESMPATADTPTGLGTTNKQWWTTDWHYFVMPEAAKEALRSDGTAFTVVGDSNITAGVLLTNGVPQYPIVISLASEAIRNDEIAPLTNYVAAGGFLLVGSSAFTRNTNGTTRGDFAFAKELGVHMVVPGLTNWLANNTLTKQADHRLIGHIPAGTLAWGLPSAAEEISWGISPDHPYLPPHQVWQVQPGDATGVAQGDSYPCLLVKPFGKGYFIYYAVKQPLIGHGGWAPGMYAYLVFRKAVEWAFDAAKLPVAKLSPWPYPYDAAFMVRHDLENLTNEIADIAASAQVEYTNGARGDYYFCTGTLREDASPTYNTNTIVLGLRQAVTNYGATIGPHNGGLKNPNNSSLVHSNYDYWHWGPDEALDSTPTNYASGKVYALASISNSFANIESWLSGITNGLRAWASPYFNATREDSYDIQSQLAVKIAGEQKLTPFPHWTVSTRTSGKRYGILSEPVSDWYVSGNIAQDLEPWHPPIVHTTVSVHDALDFYYNLGALVNIYSHSLATGLGDAGQLMPDYITYGLNTNLHPRMWSANAVGIDQWWLQRSNAQVSVTYTTSGCQVSTIVAISRATHTNTAIELVVPGTGTAFGLQVFTNGVLAGSGRYRTNGQVIKVLVGTSVTNANIRYVLGPKAQNDLYTATNGAMLQVAAPGVLSNDSPGLEPSLSAVLLNGPADGLLSFSPNGGFTYLPNADFAGTDSFTYQATDGGTNSSTATVNILVSSSDSLFLDGFSRASEPGPLSPWVVQAGTWSVTGGALRGSPITLGSYSIVSLSNNWTDYAVQGRFQFSAGALGGGLGGRLNAANGAHYAAWIYPAGSTAGSNVLRLIKFQTWSSYAYTNTPGAVMQEISLPDVGTNWHQLKLAFLGNRIAVYFDTTQMMSVADLEAQPYTSGGISVEMYTDTTAYSMLADDVTVSPLAAADAYVVSQDTPLTVPAPGVLGNDTPVYGTNLNAAWVSGPSHGALTLSTNGGFTYTPATNYLGTDTFTYQANDGQTNLGTVLATLTVIPINHAPVLPAQTNWTIVGQGTLLVTNTATDPDLPQQTLTYQLISAPTGASIDPNGLITWTPTTNQVPSTNTFTTRVTDNGLPSLTATNSFTVFVSAPPVVVLASTALAAEGCLPTNNAIDPGETVTMLFALKNVGTIDTVNLTASLLATNGIVAPSGPQPYGVLVSGGAAVSQPFQFTANGACGSNVTATLQLQDGSINLGTITVPFTLGQPITVYTQNFDTVTAPALPSGWTTSATGAAAPWITTNSLADSGPNAAFSTDASNVGLNELVSPSFVLPTGLAQLTFRNSYNLEYDTTQPTTAYDAGVLEIKIGTNAFTDITNAGGVFVSGGYNARVSTLYSSPLAGRGGWSGNSGGYISTVVNLPAAAAGQPIQLRWRGGADNGGPSGSGWRIDSVGISGWGCCANTAPVLLVQTNRTINELTTLTVINTATDAESPPEVLSYSLLIAPTNAVISTDGVITWTPTEAQGPGTYTITTVVSDNASPPLSATNSFSVTVNEVNSAPVLTLPTNQSIDALVPWSANAMAVDTDLPPNHLTFELVSGPSGLTVSSNGLVSWTPTRAQGPSTNTVTVRVFDDGVPRLNATNSFTLTVNEVNSAPALTVPANQTIDELVPWSANATAVDTDLPPNNLTFELVSGPSGLTVSSNGLISWTPTEAQGPSTNTVTVSVFDDGVPSLSATNSFTLTVNEVNSPPTLPVQTNQTVAGLTTLVWTNTATDPDIPANSFVYTLLAGPTNAVIDTNGIITWTPEPDQVPSTNVFTTAVTDYNRWAANEQHLSATNSFTVVVTGASHNGSLLPAQTDRTVDELMTLVVTNTATDPDIPPLALTYELVNPPTGALVDANGVITWTPNEYQGPGTYVIQTVVTNHSVPASSATNSFTVTVNEVNTPPVLSSWPDGAITGGEIFSLLNAASDTDWPANSLTYQLLEAPAGAVIDADGLITWTPAEWQVPSTNVFTTVATDYNPWAVKAQHLSATNSFSVRVYEPGVPPVIVSVNVANDAAVICWSAVAGKSYRLQYKDSPNDTNWNDLLPDVTATGSRAAGTNSLGDSSFRLYRVFQLP